MEGKREEPNRKIRLFRYPKRKVFLRKISKIAVFSVESDMLRGKRKGIYTLNTHNISMELKNENKV